jgi:hypothetical protein
MRTLYEELLAGGLSKFKRSNQPINIDILEKEFDKAEIIKADNVARYLFSGTDQDEWDIFEDFPNVAPVFENMFIEYNFPLDVLLKDRTIHMPEELGGTKIGVFIGVKENEPGPDDIRWCLNCFVWMKQSWMGGEIQLSPAYFFIMVDKYGKPVSVRDGKVKYCIDKNYTREQADVIYHRTIGHLWVPLLTLSFMHCKNVSVVSNAPHRSPSGRNRHSPRVTFKTLEIEPMKKVLQAEGQSDTEGLKRALHICRGHFKDYRERGLFGKFKDIYWWDSQVRGNISQGIVDKDYSVNLDKGDA